MAPELGIFALILAFVLSLAQAFFALVGAWRGKAVWMSVARPAVTGQFVFVAMAFSCLVYCFVNNDFSVLYVAHNSNCELELCATYSTEKSLLTKQYTRQEKAIATNTN